MKSHFLIEQIFHSAVEGEVMIRLSSGEQLPFSAGQLWIGFHDPMADLLPTALYPAMDERGEWYLAGAIPSGWQAGGRLSIHGPIGRGFTLPRSSRRVACVSLDEGVHYLMPLMQQAVRQGAEIVFCGERSPLRLPALIEVFSLNQREEWWQWADFIAVQGSLAAVAAFFKEIDEKFSLPSKKDGVEVMVRQPVYCAGMAECGVCAIPARKGWLLACRKGVVFDYSQINWSVAGLVENQPG